MFLEFWIYDTLAWDCFGFVYEVGRLIRQHGEGSVGW